MPIEVESPEQLGYDTITNNLSESSVADRRLSDLGLELELDDLLLCYGDHLGDAALREVIASGGDGLRPDDVLVTHVRLKLDELLEHPGSVNIEAHDGVVCLTGPVADRELRPLKRALRRMAGVRSLDCRLTPHAATA